MAEFCDGAAGGPGLLWWIFPEREVVLGLMICDSFSDGFVLAQWRTKSADSYTAPSSVPVPPAVEMQGREGTKPDKEGERDGTRPVQYWRSRPPSPMSRLSPKRERFFCLARIARLLVCQGNTGAWLLLVYKMSWPKPLPSLGFDQDQRQDRC